MTSSTDRPKRRLEDVQFILKDLLKVIKVVSLYPEDNPLPQSLKRTFSEKLESIVEEYGRIAICVARDRLTLDDETVFADRSKEESLAGMFFDIGVTSFTFREGLAVEEIYRLLDVFKTYMNSPGRNLDLVALLWEAQISRFQVTTLEDLALAEYEGDLNVQVHFTDDDRGPAQGHQMSTDQYNALFDSAKVPIELENDDELPTASAEVTESTAAHAFYAADGEAGNVLDTPGLDAAAYQTAAAAEAMGLGNLQLTPAAHRPDTTLILNDELKLSEEDEGYIERLTREDADFDLYEATSELVKEILHQETEMNGFYESVTVAEKVIGELLQAGKLVYAGQVLGYLRSLEEQVRDDRPLWAERLKDARIAMGSRERLAKLCDALNEHEEIGQGDLRRYLNQFGWEALSGMTDLLGEFKHEQHREALCDFLAERGREKSHIVAKGLSDRRWEVVRNSVIVMSRIGGTEAIKQLHQVVRHPEREVRLALVNALAGCSETEALDILKDAIRDRDREVRRGAIASLVRRRNPAAFETITEIINDEAFARLDRDDQQAVLNAYSILGRDQAVEYLVALATKANLTRNSNIAFFRLAAFEALSNNASERAEHALVKLTSSWRPDVRRQAIEAMNRRRQLIYGVNDD